MAEKNQESENTDLDSIVTDLDLIVKESLQGNKVFFVPPGGYLSSIFIPLLAIGSMALAFMLTAGFFPLETKTGNDLASLIVPIGLAIVLTGIGFTGFLCLIFGSSHWARWLVVYIASLLIIAVILFSLAIVGGISIPTGISVTSVVTLTITLLIARSSAFKTLAAYFSLKRAYQKRSQF